MAFGQPDISMKTNRRVLQTGFGEKQRLSFLSFFGVCLGIGLLLGPIALICMGETPLPVLTKAQHVRELAPEEASRSYPVRLAGVVT